MIWPENPALSGVILLLIALPFLYAARRPVHNLIYSVARAINSPLRLGARWLMLTADELRRRNKVVLLAHGREEVIQTIEREFERVSALVQRDLHGYPALQRKVMNEITRIEEDFQKCGEVPPAPPEWAKAVSAIAKIKPTSDGLVENILENISKSIERIYDKALVEYRRAYQERHRILKGFMPFWRSLNQTLARVDKNLTGLSDSAAGIDAQMEKYESINAKTEKAEHALTSSSTTQFFIALLVLVIALGGAFVNFWLIERPMSAMVGGGQYVVGDLEASHIAALVIILVEASMGIFLMETMRITHLFPGIGNMRDGMRHRLFWIFLTILITLAGVEVALAVLRDRIIAADIAFKTDPGAIEAIATPVATWVTNIPTIGQMILGFILPIALAFVAIPLEYFIYSSRTVLGVVLVMAIRSTAFGLRILGNVFKHVGNMLVLLFDVIIFVPLLIERMFFSHMVDAKSDIGSDSKSAGVTAFRKRSATGEHTL